jgi:hypothetical protein
LHNFTVDVDKLGELMVSKNIWPKKDSNSPVPRKDLVSIMGRGKNQTDVWKGLMKSNPEIKKGPLTGSKGSMMIDYEQVLLVLQTNGAKDGSPAKTCVSPK